MGEGKLGSYYHFNVPHYTFRYNVVFLVITYGIPILIMIYAYSAMGKELWGSRSIGELTERQLESMKSKKKVRPKVTRKEMRLIILTHFLLCHVRT